IVRHVQPLAREHEAAPHLARQPLVPDHLARLPFEAHHAGFVHHVGVLADDHAGADALRRRRRPPQAFLGHVPLAARLDPARQPPPRRPLLPRPTALRPPPAPPAPLSALHSSDPSPPPPPPPSSSRKRTAPPANPLPARRAPCASRGPACPRRPRNRPAWCWD